MPIWMLLISVALLLPSCTEMTVKERQAAGAKEPIVERSAATDFDPADTPQEQQDKAEARGAAQAEAALQGGDANERKRENIEP